MLLSFIPQGPPPGPMLDAALRTQHDPSVPAVLPPANFPARATTTTSRRQATEKGRLWISEAGVWFTDRSGDEVRLRHEGDSILLGPARALSPWTSTFLILRAGNSRLRVTVSTLRRRQLKRALRAAGVAITPPSGRRGSG